MSSDDQTTLRSRYLQDIEAEFRRSPSYFGKPELIREPADSLLDELLEAVTFFGAGETSLYQILTIWGDQLATYVVCESVKKRLHHLVMKLHEFPLAADPKDIVASFWWSIDHLQRL